MGNIVIKITIDTLSSYELAHSLKNIEEAKSNLLSDACLVYEQAPGESVWL